MPPTPTLAPVAARSEIQPRERRLHYRYPIKLELEYKALYQGRDQLHGYGRTLNISSGEIFFQASGPLSARGPIELVVNWPFLRGGCALKLVARGRIIRSDAKGIAVKVIRHEFRASAACSASERPTA